MSIYQKNNSKHKNKDLENSKPGGHISGENYKIRKGLSFKPSFTFLVLFPKQPLIQVNNFNNIANGFEVNKLYFRRGGLSGNKAKNLC